MNKFKLERIIIAIILVIGSIYFLQEFISNNMYIEAVIYYAFATYVTVNCIYP